MTGEGERAAAAAPRLALVALCRHRLRRHRLARLGWLASLLVMATTMGMGATMSAGALYGDLVLSGTRWVLWLGLLPFGLAVANNPEARDRRDGVELMASLRGVGPARLRRARLGAALIEAPIRIAVPVLLLCLGSLALGAAWRAVAWQAAGLALFALIAGPILGALASVCGHVGAERGRWLLLAALVLPWAMTDTITGLPLSVPAAVDAGLELLGRVEASWP